MALSSGWDRGPRRQGHSARSRASDNGAAWTWWPALGSAVEAENLLGEPGPVENVDRERAAGLALTLMLAHGRVGRVTRVASRAFVARCALHLDLPPFVVPRELAIARAGLVDGAVAALQDAKATHQSGPDYLAVERALMLLVRRFRLRDVGIGPTSGLLDSSEVADQSLLADLTAHDGDKATISPWQFGAPASAAPDVLHLWWRAVRAGDPTALADAREWPYPLVVDADSPSADLHRRLDAAELARLTSRSSPPLPDVTAWARAHPGEPEAALRLHLRVAALTGSDLVKAEVEAEVEALAARLGPNLAAEIAFDEGDSMALRLPVHAPVILEDARRWFARSGDAAGELRAATAAALAVLAASGTDAVRDVLDTVEGSYVRVTRVLDLPPWERLREQAEWELTTSPPCWQPWVARVAVLLTAAASGSRGETVLDELYRRFGATGGGGRLVLPAELASAVAGIARSRTVVSRGLSPSPRADGLAPPVNLEIIGVGSGTHITRGNPVRVRALSAEGVFLSDTALNETDLLRPYAMRLEVPTPLAPALAALPPNAPLAVHHSADLGAAPWEAIVTAALAQAVREAAEQPTRTIWRRLQRARRRTPGRSLEWSVLSG